MIKYQDGELTIEGHHSALSEILRAVAKQTGAVIDFPPEANQPVDGHIGPGGVADVLDCLLKPLRFNYAILGSPGRSNTPVRVILSAKTTDIIGPPQGQSAQSTRASAGIVQVESSPHEESEPEYWERRQMIQQDLIGRLNARGKHTIQESQSQTQEFPQ